MGALASLSHQSRKTDNAVQDYFSNSETGLGSAAVGGVAFLIFHNAYAGSPRPTIPNPIDAFPGVEIITFSTSAAAASTNTRGVQGYPGTM